ncbi:MAG: TRAP transporter small permease [Geminicoccaceae bacterium]
MPAILGRWADAMAVLAGFVLFVIVAVTTTNVGAFILDRFLPGDVAGLPGYEDFVQLVIGGAALMFLPHCQARRGHVAVELFVERLPRSFQRVTDRLWLALTAAIALFLAYWMLQGLFQAKNDTVITAVLGWPVWPFYIPGLLALLLWAAIALGQIVGKDDHD